MTLIGVAKILVGQLDMYHRTREQASLKYVMITFIPFKQPSGNVSRVLGMDGPFALRCSFICSLPSPSILR